MTARMRAGLRPAGARGIVAPISGPLLPASRGRGHPIRTLAVVRKAQPPGPPPYSFHPGDSGSIMMLYPPDHMARRFLLKIRPPPRVRRTPGIGRIRHDRAAGPIAPRRARPPPPRTALPGGR